MEHWTLTAMELALSVGGHRSVPEPSDPRGAAVAAVLRETVGLDLLLIQRAERAGDPWSGHIAFPGGRIDAQDPSPRRAAVRETVEEVGLDLDRYGHPIGALAPRPAVGRGRRLGFEIHPFVFGVGPAHPPLVPEPAEVRSTLWVPLAHLADPAHRDAHPYHLDGVTHRLPCVRYREHVIWGLTLRMIEDLLVVARTIPDAR